ncbi:MAG: D-aminoacylase [Clostridia bacterium]|nr:D-aminoacylase [Clostridia bacterium]
MKHVIIRGGTVVDGTGKPAFRADVETRGGVITAIGDLSGQRAEEVLDADGLTVAPGFIDAHAHSDTAFLKDDSGASKLYQGITAEISGNCGSSPFPALPERLGDSPWHCASFADFLRKFDAEGRTMGVSQAMLVGHGTLREGVIGAEARPVTEKELEQMKTLLRRDLEAGAWGMSMGLEYAPGCFADAEELSALAKVVKEYNGIVTAHMRSEGLHIDEAIHELLTVGRVSGAHVHVSHLKLDNYRVNGRAREVWELLENARREGVYVTTDMYPYTASCTTLTIRCPKWSLDGGDGEVVKFLQGPRRQEIIASLRAHYFNAQRAETCLFSDDGGLWPEIVGKNLRQVAEDMLGTTDYAEAAAEVLTRTRAKAWCIFFVMDEQDVLYFLSRDVNIGTDSRALSGDPAKVRVKPHPRAYGAMAEFFRLAREKRFCSLEEAVRRVTGETAERFGIKDRGIIAAGKAADITVFDPETIAPRATYLNSVQLAMGVEHVLVNGGVALKNGRQTDCRGGRFLRKP